MVITIEVVRALDLPALYKTVTPEKFFERYVEEKKNLVPLAIFILFSVAKHFH